MSVKIEVHLKVHMKAHDLKLVNNLLNSTGIRCSRYKWDFIPLVLYSISTKCLSMTKAGTGCYDLAVSPVACGSV